MTATPSLELKVVVPTGGEVQQRIFPLDDPSPSSSRLIQRGDIGDALALVSAIADARLIPNKSVCITIAFTQPLEGRLRQTWHGFGVAWAAPQRSWPGLGIVVVCGVLPVILP